MAVFVPMDTRDDISAALKFGELRYINRFYIHGDELGRCGDDNVIPDQYRDNIGRAVREFRSDADYLLIVGDHLQLLAIAAMLGALLDSFMVLRYDRQMNEYIPVRLYSGLVPPPATVLVSGTDIGESTHGESRNQTIDDTYRVTQAIVEAPLARRDPAKRPS